MFQTLFANQRIRDRPYLRSKKAPRYFLSDPGVENRDLDNLREQIFAYVRKNSDGKHYIPFIQRIMARQQQSIRSINEWTRKEHEGPQPRNFDLYYNVLFYLTSCIPLQVSRLTLYRGMAVHRKQQAFVSFLEQLTENWKVGVKEFIDKIPVMYPNSFWGFSANMRTAERFMGGSHDPDALKIMIVIPNIMNSMYGMTGDPTEDEIVLGPDAEIHIFRSDYKPQQLIIYAHLVQPTPKCDVQILRDSLKQLDPNAVPVNYEELESEIEEDDASWMLPRLPTYLSY